MWLVWLLMSMSMMGPDLVLWDVWLPMSMFMVIPGLVLWDSVRVMPSLLGTFHCVQYVAVSPPGFEIVSSLSSTTGLVTVLGLTASLVSLASRDKAMTTINTRNRIIRVPDILNSCVAVVT